MTRYIARLVAATMLLLFVAQVAEARNKNDAPKGESQSSK